MDFRQLKYFHAVAKHESLTAASEALNVTQPAIGQQIRKLEAELGLKLLTRHSRGMRPTSVGKVLFQRAEDILGAVESTRRELSRHRNTSEGTVRIGVTPSLSRVLVPRLMELGFDRHPGITLLFNQGFPADLESMWEAGECDFAFFDRDVDTDEAESLPVYNECLCLIGPPDLCGPLPDPVPISEVAGLPVVLDVRAVWSREQLERGFKKTGSKWVDLIECSSIEIRREYLVRGRRFCVAPIAQFNDEIAAGLADHRGIDLSIFNRTVHLAGPRVENMTEAQRNIRTLIVEIADDLIKAANVAWQPPEWTSAESSNSSTR